MLLHPSDGIVGRIPSACPSHEVLPDHVRDGVIGTASGAQKCVYLEEYPRVTGVSFPFGASGVDLFEQSALLYVQVDDPVAVVQRRPKAVPHIRFLVEILLPVSHW